jgi:hypothetical protein
MRIQLAPGTTLTSIEGKDVLFSVKTGESYGLNDTAARMLRLGIETNSERVATELSREYGVEPAEIRHDFEELVGELDQLKMIQLLSDQGA